MTTKTPVGNHQPSAHGLRKPRRRLGRPARIALALLLWPPAITIVAGALLSLAGF